MTEMELCILILSMVKGMSGAVAAVLWLRTAWISFSLEWRSGRRKGPRRGSAMSWGSSCTQPPNCPTFLGSPARTSQTHLLYCQHWELCRRCCISGTGDPARALSAPLATVFRAWEIHMLLIYSVSYNMFGTGKLYMDQRVDRRYRSWLGDSCVLW